MTETTNSPTKPNEPACTECSRLASRVEELEKLLRWFVDQSTHEGFCSLRPPVNPGYSYKCDWPEMKEKAEDALSRAQGK